LIDFLSVRTETESVDNNGSNDGIQRASLNAAQREQVVDILRQQTLKLQQQQQEQPEQQRGRVTSAPDSAGIPNHIVVKKPVVPLPVQQHQRRPNSDDHTSGPNQYRHVQQQEPESRGEFYSNIPGYKGANDGEQGDDYENIEIVVNTAKVLQVFDDALVESDATPDRRPSSTLLRSGQTSQDESTTDMLSLAENARQKLIQRRSRENSTSEASADHNAPAVGLRPVPQQRLLPIADQQSEQQFKQLLAAKAANRRLPEESVREQDGRSSNHPVPVSRVGVPRAVSVDEGAPGKTCKQPAPVRQKVRSVTSDEANSQQAYSEVSRPVIQRRSVEIGRQPSVPAASSAAAAAYMVHDDFDLPPPPEEYCNLPAVTGRQTSTLPHGLPAATNNPPVAARFRQNQNTTDHHDLPPPPSGFHDDVPPQPRRTSGTVSGPMCRWSRDEVVHWLETLNMPELCAAFSAASITGQRLIQLTEDDFYALGVTQFGQRKMLQRAIENRGDDW